MAVALAEPGTSSTRTDVLRAALGTGPRADAQIRCEDLARASVVLPGAVPLPGSACPWPFSWDRRTRRLEQSTETDVTLTSEVTDTTKETDECVPR